MELTFDLPDDGIDLPDMWIEPRGRSRKPELSELRMREGTALRGQGGDEFVITSDVPIGSGNSGEVYSGAVVASGVTVAIKVFDRMEIDDRPDKIKRLTCELNIKRKLRHPNLINLLDVAFDDFRAMLIMEMADGGTLFDLVSAGTPLPEGRARYLFKQMVSAVSYCHDLQIYHRDLRLENIVLASDGTDTLKIAGFGATDRKNDTPRKVPTLFHYLAPEMVSLKSILNEDESSYRAGVDIWSLGVILYALTTCNYPFGFDGPRRLGGISAAKVCQNIRRGVDAVDFPVTMSPELVKLLRGLFVIQVEMRPRSASRPAGCPEWAQPCQEGARCNNHASPHRLSWWHPPLPGQEPEPEPEPEPTFAETTDVLVPPIDEFRWSIGRVRSCAWLKDLEAAERRLALAKGLGDRLAADSPLLLLDVDVVHSIAFVLSQPCRIALAGVRDAAATAMAVPTIAEIVWPDIDNDPNTPVYIDADLNTPAVDPFNDDIGLDATVDDDDIGL